MSECTAPMTSSDLIRFGMLVAAVDEHIRACLAEDSHCKTYEGTWTLHAPSYFERTTAPDTRWLFERRGWSIDLACYLIGPGRGYTWRGGTFAEALDAAQADITRWIAEEQVSRASASAVLLSHLSSTEKKMVPRCANIAGPGRT